jgi:hypothetical protein
MPLLSSHSPRPARRSRGPRGWDGSAGRCSALVVSAKARCNSYTAFAVTTLPSSPVTACVAPLVISGSSRCAIHELEPSVTKLCMMFGTVLGPTGCRYIFTCNTHVSRLRVYIHRFVGRLELIRIYGCSNTSTHWFASMHESCSKLPFQ